MQNLQPEGEKTMLTKVSDQELIQSFRQGKKEAAEELFQRYYKKIYYLCYQILSSNSDAQDCAQEVFCKIIGEKKIFRFRGDSKFSTWLTRVAINVCKTHIRSKSRRKMAYLGDEAETYIPEAMTCRNNTPEESYVERELNRKMREGICSLPPKCQRAMHCVYVQDYSYKEAAKALKVPVNVLGVRLMYGRKLLSRFFQRELEQRKSQEIFETANSLGFAFN
jgi:RNA polymerase sigma-70 factor, ECF subfamily